MGLDLVRGAELGARGLLTDEEQATAESAEDTEEAALVPPKLHN